MNNHTNLLQTRGDLSHRSRTLTSCPVITCRYGSQRSHEQKMSSHKALNIFQVPPCNILLLLGSVAKPKLESPAQEKDGSTWRRGESNTVRLVTACHIKRQQIKSSTFPRANTGSNRRQARKTPQSKIESQRGCEKREEVHIYKNMLRKQSRQSDIQISVVQVSMRPFRVHGARFNDDSARIKL